MNLSTEVTAAERPFWRTWLGSARAARGIRILLSLIIVAASVVPLARFVGVALARVGYPFDLEWCEGGTLGHIRVVLAGQHIYREPSLEFTPYLYPPLYYYVSALPSLLLGAGHLAPRLVSLASILGCFVLLGRWVRDETGDPVAGLAAVGLLSATYQLTGFWFELARVDAFFLLLVFASHITARTAKTDARAALVGVFIAAACFTKQLGIPLALPALLLLAVRSFRLSAIAALVSGALIVVTATAFNLSSKGWFLYYVLDLPSRHEIEWQRFWPSVQTYFLGVTFPMTVAGVVLLCGLGFRPAAWKRWLCYALFVGLACATSFLPFLKSGGYPNGLIPSYAALALASGLVLGALRRARGSALGSLGPQLVACLLLLLQLVLLDYDPQLALPTAADLEANQQVMARLEKLKKPLFVTGSSFYTMTAGDAGIMTDTMGLIDIYKGGGPQAQHLNAALLDAIHQHRFKTIVLDRAAGFLPNNVVEAIRREYVERGSVLRGLPGDVIWPKSGASVRPDSIWVVP
ncbi:MAG TPA: glycosyltransferase family 39 protein [Polyangiaceae bacterium]